MKKIYLLKETIKFHSFLCHFVLLILIAISNNRVNAQSVYCTPNYATGTGSGDYISLVEIPTTSLNSPSGASSNPYYTFFSNTGSTTATLNIGSNYPLNVAGGTYGTCYIACWGDWNHDTIFDASEFIGVSPNVGALITAVFSSGITIPNYALSGSTRLRFRSSDTSPGPAVNQSCNSTNSAFGETEDYEIYLLPLPPCSGSPIGGNTISTNTLVCANTSFNLGLANNSLSSGISYQWQSSPNGSTWSNIGIAQISSQLVINNITSTTYYQCVSTCTSSALSSTSTPILVNLNPLINCYCIPAYALICANGDNISDFSISNVVLQPSNCDFNGYSDSTSSAFTVINLSAGNTYTLQANIANSGNGGNMAAGAWIDYNQNGIFDASEFTYLGNGGTQIYSNTLMVPITTPSGLIRMRIKLDANYANASTVLDPCDNNNFSTYGQILDYKVNMIAAPACSGVPNAGNATSTETAVCQNKPYTLNLSNNSIASNITYQWQSSLNGTTWTNLGVVQNTIPYSISTQSITTYYRCITTCTTSAQTGTSTVIIVNQNLLTDCYCAPTNVSCANTSIASVTFENLSDNPICDVLTGYTFNSVNTVTLSANQSYTLSTTFGSQSTAYFGAWIDYNQDGIFGSNEFTDLGNGPSGTLTGTINVPFTALQGSTRMRLRVEGDWSNVPTLDPCSNSNFDGQILDYPIYLNAATPCTGTPNAGNATSTFTSICDNTPFTLNLNSNSIASNITYQWQSSPDNVVWTNLGTVQNTVPYSIASQTSTAYYRCITTCTTSALTSTSTAWTITQNAVTACYCYPGDMDCTGSDLIKYVSFATMTNTSTCGNNGYSDFTSSVVSATVTSGQTYSIATALGYMYGENVHVWIDYDQNGIFDASEYKGLGSNNGNDTIFSTIDIPFGATPGTTRMRVRNISGLSLGAGDACNTPTFAPRSGLISVMTGANAYGESEDYLVTIQAPDCSVINFPPTIPLSGNYDICPGSSAALDLATALPTATGITYQWKYYNGSAYVNIGSANTTSGYTVSPTANTLYFCEVLCNGSFARGTDTVLVKVQQITTSPITTSVTCNGLSNGAITVNAFASGSVLSYTWTPNVGSTDIVSGLTAGTYTVFIVNGFNCAITETISINEPSSLTVTPSFTNVTCNGGNNGTISLLASGGSPGYNYSWPTTSFTTSTISNLTAGNYTYNVTDANGCVTSQSIGINQPGIFSASINASSASICEQLEDTITSTIIGGTGPFNYNWMKLPSTTVSTNPNYSYTTSVGTNSYNLSVTDINGCIAVSNTVSILVNPSSNFSGTVTTYPNIPVAGSVTLYKYEPFYTKFDSVTTQNIGASGDFLFSSFKSGIYIIKAIPTATNMQITYGDSAVNWKTATQIIHGCAVNDVQNINVKALQTFTPGTGSLSGTIREGDKYGKRTANGFNVSAPGNPIGGIIVKGGKNPGGQMFVQTISSTVTATKGQYTLQNLPFDDFFILVDVPGLDTNGTYYRSITFSNNSFQGLDFVIDSAKINPVPSSAISVNDILAKQHQVKLFPNPANNNVTITYNLATNSMVKIELIDLLGKTIKTILPLTEQSLSDYFYNVPLNDLTSGLYFMKLTINSKESTIKLSVNH